jgi:hypothetical protein
VGPVTLLAAPVGPVVPVEPVGPVLPVVPVCPVIPNPYAMSCALKKVELSLFKNDGLVANAVNLTASVVPLK